jgi:membrane-associated protein
MQNLLHLDKYLPQLVAHYGPWIYAIFFAVVFGETGLVVLPFLPGDSLLFACGAYNMNGGLPLVILYPLFIAAAFAGDSVNYWIGREFGRRLFKNENSRIFSRGNLEKTEHFFEKHGNKAIILARFVPIVRTFAPFVAGMGRMHFATFMSFNLIGGVLWVGLFISLGHFFGQIPVVKGHFELVVLAIIILSLVPILIEFVRHRRESGRAT